MNEAPPRKMSDRVDAEQFFDRRYLANIEGERRMLQVMLIDAIECWQSVPEVEIMGEHYVASLRERLYREAHFWIFGRYNNAPFFSFTQTCDCLGVNPDFIRRRLLEWRQKSVGR